MDAGDAFERWRALAAKAAKTAGTSIDALTSLTPGGVAVEPLFPRYVGEVRQPWRTGSG